MDLMLDCRPCLSEYNNDLKQLGLMFEKTRTVSELINPVKRSLLMLDRQTDKEPVDRYSITLRRAIRARLYEKPKKDHDKDANKS